jgi:ATP-binding cassette subfamily B protein
MTGRTSVAAATWPARRSGDAVLALAETTGCLDRRTGRAVEPELGFEAAGARLGVEVEPVHAALSEVRQLLRCGGPLIVPLADAAGEPPGLVLVIGAKGRSVRVLTPEGRVGTLSVQDLEAALRPVDRSASDQVDRLLDAAGVSTRRRARARATLLEVALGGRYRVRAWLLRRSPASDWRAQLRGEGLVRQAAAAAGLHGLRCLALVAAWWLVGRGVLQGRLDAGWLAGWALLLATMVPLDVAALAVQGRFVVSFGALLKQRLLCGVLGYDSDAVRGLGTGQLLGRVVESQAVESLTLSGGSSCLVAAIELLTAAVVLGLGAAGGWHVAALLAWLVLGGGLMVRMYRARLGANTDRLDLTHDMVEQMLGHRTRLAQLLPARWHDGEDALLERYLHSARRRDAVTPLVMALPSAWMIVGMAVLVPGVVAGTVTGAGAAIALGGMLLARRGLARLAGGATSVVGALVAWQRVGEIFRSARGALPAGGSATEPGGGEPLLEARELVYGYPDRARPAVAGVDLELCSGDRVLLTGPSGGGKSTLVSLLCGVRRAHGGLLLLDGLDLPTLGSTAWRSRVAAAPQTNDNHVLTETFLFNLLMGRAWPPRPEHVREAEAVCRELGLGELLDRMPSGLQQLVGDTGWRLSHGERDRLYLARALLQGADVVVLDESFASLDPDTLERALECARRRAGSLVVVSHC